MYCVYSELVCVLAEDVWVIYISASTLLMEPTYGHGVSG